MHVRQERIDVRARAVRKSGQSKLPGATVLLSREDFSRHVFARDDHRCVFCPAPAVDAHHLIERKLFPDGGYYLANGIAVCSEHHFACERTDISVEEGRRAAGIVEIVVPPGFDPGKSWDKWGNEVLSDGTRLMGPFFDRENVQKVLGQANLDLFVG